MSWDVSITSKSSSSSLTVTAKDMPEERKIISNFNECVAKPTNAIESGILKTRTLQFTEYRSLEIKTRHEFYSKSLLNIGNQ